MAKRTKTKPAGTNALSIAQLNSELRSRQRQINSLVKRRERLAAKVAEIGARIASLGGTETGKRHPNNAPLVEELARLLDGKTMGVAEAAEAVQKAGYKTVSPNFRAIVNRALLHKPFTRVARGRYTVR